MIKVKVTGVKEAVAHLKQYSKSLVDKQKRFLQRLADEGVEVASAKFASAAYDGTNDVNVTAEWVGNNTINVVANGQSVAFIEFGTGVRYPDIHPKAAEFGAVRGEFGYKLGSNPRGWRYKGDPGTNGRIIEKGKHAGEVHTYGNPPSMAMYYTAEELKRKVTEVAREVYGS